MTVEALTQFMLSQGPSQAVVSLEWDSIWTANKKIIDPIAPRHWALVKEKWSVFSWWYRFCFWHEVTLPQSVLVKIIDGPATPEVKLIPKHKKNAKVGEKKTVYSSFIIIEQEDAESFNYEANEEVKLWHLIVIHCAHTIGYR